MADINNQILEIKKELKKMEFNGIKLLLGSKRVLVFICSTLLIKYLGVTDNEVALMASGLIVERLWGVAHFQLKKLLKRLKYNELMNL